MYNNCGSKFQIDLERGKHGEDIILKNIPQIIVGIKEIIDVREEKLFQLLDVDFIFVTNKGKSILIEVKTDSLADKTGNIAYEYVSNKKFNTIGCFEKTKSDLILYYLENTNEMHIIKTKDLQEHIRRNKNKMCIRPMGDSALGYLIKIETLIKENVILKTIKVV